MRLSEKAAYTDRHAAFGERRLHWSAGGFRRKPPTLTRVCVRTDDVSEQDRGGFPPPEYANRQGRNWLATCLVGCLIVGLVSLVVCAGGLWFAWGKFVPIRP
jgi:hypothetical protein